MAFDVTCSIANVAFTLLSFLFLEYNNQLNCVVVAGWSHLLVPLNQKAARTRVYRPFSWRTHMHVKSHVQLLTQHSGLYTLQIAHRIPHS